MTVRVTQLSSGLRVVTDEMPHVRTVSLGAWVGAGARHETADQHGLSHLLEHMAFKGTRRRTARQIAEEIENAGGDINAATGMETTAYYARVLKDDVALALDVLADIVLEPVFDEAELARERQVVIQEIAAVRDTPDDLVFDLAQEAAFPDQPLGRSILGTAETVSGFSPESIAGYRDTHYGAPSIVISAAGAIDHDRLVELAEKAFAGLRLDRGPGCGPGRYRGGEIAHRKTLEQSHAVLAFEAPGYTDSRFYTLQILSTILGGGLSSRLFQEIRERRGLCYTVGSFVSAYADCGLLGIYAATSPNQADELFGAGAGELEKFASGVTEDEVARARAQLKSGLLMSLESSSARADQIARQLIVFDRVLPVEEIEQRIDSVDSAAVTRLMQSVLSAPQPTIATVGPSRRPPTLRALAAGA